MVIDRAKTVRGAFAGAVAAGVWLAQQPLDKPVFGVDYDDSELLGKAFTRGPAWPVVGAVIHLGNGALMGAAYATVAARMPLPSWSRGPIAALVEHVATWPLTLAVERRPPARDDLPRLAASGRAVAPATGPPGAGPGTRRGGRRAAPAAARRSLPRNAQISRGSPSSVAATGA
jgi:hypothetical protein